jgi:RNA-directed DNA polymerase
VVPFSKPSSRGERVQGKGTFEFLGFPPYWARSRQGYWVIKRRAAKRRVRRTLKALWPWCRSNRHWRGREQPRRLGQKLRGPYQYYGIRGNYRLLEAVFKQAEKAWRYWLNRRSQKGPRTGDKREWWRTYFPFPAPRIIHNL